jgi:hypothetical protein
MSNNRGVAYIGPGKVEVQGIEYPKFVAPNGKEIDHGVILASYQPISAEAISIWYADARPLRPV